MRCANCNRNFEIPLELYNNELKCPHCLKNVIPEKFSVSDESEEYFRLSEAAYYSYLELMSSDVKDRISNESIRYKAPTKAFNSMVANRLEIAIDYCRRAAYMGHPEAIVKLGYYYDNDLIDYGGSNMARDKIAKEYYTRVLYDFSGNESPEQIKISSEHKRDELLSVWNKTDEDNRNRNDKVLQQDEVTISKKVDSLRLHAAVYLLSMLKNTAQELRQKRDYDFDYVMKILVECGVIESSDFMSNSSTFAFYDHVESVKSVIEGLSAQSVRTPVFGYDFLRGNELKGLYEWIMKRQGKGEITLPDLLYIPLKSTDNGHVYGDNASHDVCSAGKIYSFDSGIEDGRYYAIFFYNGAARGVYAKRNTIEPASNLYQNLRAPNDDALRYFGIWIEDELKAVTPNGNDIATSFNLLTGHVFCADDFYFLRNSKHDHNDRHPLAPFFELM